MTTLDRPHLSLEISVTLRTATEDDLPKLEWFGQYRHFRNLFRRTFREQKAGRRLMLLADLNSFPIGHVFIHFKTNDLLTPRAYLYSFRVMEMFRGQGIGTWLIQEAESLTLERQLARISIAVAKDNTSALRLYRRLGYGIVGDDDGRWSYLDHRGKIRHVHEPCWLLEKNLIAR